MSLRSTVPLCFLLVMAASFAAAGLLGHGGGSGLLWWMNQEVYTRLRRIFYLAERLPLGPFQLAFLFLLAAAVFSVFARDARAVFIANHVALVAVVYAGLFDWRASFAILRPVATHAPRLLVSRIDWSLAVAVIAALASTLACHLRYWRHRAGAGRLAEILPGT